MRADPGRFIAVIYSIVMPKFKLVQKLVDRLNLVVREHLSGMMVIRAFGTQSYEEDRFEVANRNLTRNYRFVNRVTAFMMPAMMFLMNVMSLVIVWIGGHQIEQATMQVGDMMAFMQYAMQIIMAFLMICMTFILMPRAAVSVNRVNEVLATEPPCAMQSIPFPLEKIRVGKSNSATFASAMKMQMKM